MTEVIKIPPFDKIPVGPDTNGYRDERGAEDVERELREAGITFSFERTLKLLRNLFPEEEVLKVFEGGCGFGNTLRDIHQIAGGLNIAVCTTGATMSEGHIPADPEKGNGIDRLLVGNILNHYKHKTIGKGYHFLLDYFGALWYEAAFVESYPPFTEEGQLVIPVYKAISAPNSMGLILMRGLDDTIPLTSEERHNPVFKAYKRAHAEDNINYIRSQSFKVIEQLYGYVFIQKETDSFSLSNLARNFRIGSGRMSPHVPNLPGYS